MGLFSLIMVILCLLLLLGLVQYLKILAIYDKISDFMMQIDTQLHSCQHSLDEIKHEVKGIGIAKSIASIYLNENPQKEEKGSEDPSMSISPSQQEKLETDH